MSDGDGHALGRFPWLAPFLRRARRLRPVLPMMILLVELGTVFHMVVETPNRARSCEVGSVCGGVLATDSVAEQPGRLGADTFDDGQQQV